MLVIASNFLQSLFQFPSNGKGFPNGYTCSYDSKKDQSFNSLQTGKAFRTSLQPLNASLRNQRFNSLQTGKAFRTDLSDLYLYREREFQFPSNGKGFPNVETSGNLTLSWKEEFQFPSNGKGFPNQCGKFSTTPQVTGFNSLQTGKAFRTAMLP